MKNLALVTRIASSDIFSDKEKKYLISKITKKKSNADYVVVVISAIGVLLQVLQIVLENL